MNLKLNDHIGFQQTYYQESFFEPLPHFPTVTRPLETIQRSFGDFPHGASELTATLKCNSSRTVLTARYALTNLPDQADWFRQRFDDAAAG